MSLFRLGFRLCLISTLLPKEHYVSAMLFQRSVYGSLMFHLCSVNVTVLLDTFWPGSGYVQLRAPFMFCLRLCSFYGSVYVLAMSCLQFRLCVSYILSNKFWPCSVYVQFRDSFVFRLRFCLCSSYDLSTVLSTLQ